MNFIIKGFEVWHDLHGTSRIGLGMSYKIVVKQLIAIFIHNTQKYDL